MENILDFAKARGYREGENPARWRGHLDKLLPAQSKVRQVEHHAALAYAELPAFLASLRGQEGIAARALEFAILTAARTGEVIGAQWSEIDPLDKTWTVPATRMKAHREHRVPLSARALAILDEMQRVRHTQAGEAFVFPGGKPGKPLSNMAFLMLLRRMGRANLTAHGFRATFKTWASERTSFQNEIAEASLAHVIGGKVEQAYRRGDMFDKRRRLMQQWAAFCTTAPAQERQGNVTPLRAS
jgi:integrase